MHVEVHFVYAKHVRLLPLIPCSIMEQKARMMEHYLTNINADRLVCMSGSGVYEGLLNKQSLVTYGRNNGKYN